MTHHPGLPGVKQCHPSVSHPQHERLRAITHGTRRFAPPVHVRGDGGDVGPPLHAQPRRRWLSSGKVSLVKHHPRPRVRRGDDPSRMRGYRKVKHARIFCPWHHRLVEAPPNVPNLHGSVAVQGKLRALHVSKQKNRGSQLVVSAQSLGSTLMPHPGEIFWCQRAVHGRVHTTGAFDEVSSRHGGHPKRRVRRGPSLVAPDPDPPSHRHDLRPVPNPPHSHRAVAIGPNHQKLLRTLVHGWIIGVPIEALVHANEGGHPVQPGVNRPEEGQGPCVTSQRFSQDLTRSTASRDTVPAPTSYR